MLEISVLELLYVVLMFFVVVIGTLLTTALLRVLKILKVAQDITNYYWEGKEFIENVSHIPKNMLQNLVSFFTKSSEEEYEEEDDDIWYIEKNKKR